MLSHTVHQLFFLSPLFVEHSCFSVNCILHINLVRLHLKCSKVPFDVDFPLGFIVEGKLSNWFHVFSTHFVHCCAFKRGFQSHMSCPTRYCNSSFENSNVIYIFHVNLGNGCAEKTKKLWMRLILYHTRRFCSYGNSTCEFGGV